MEDDYSEESEEYTFDDYNNDFGIDDEGEDMMSHDWGND